MGGRTRSKVTALVCVVLILATAYGVCTAAEVTTHTVRIIHYGGKSVVVPGYVIVKPGDTVEFKTIGDSVTVIIPDKDVSEERADTFDIGPGKTNDLLVMKTAYDQAKQKSEADRQKFWRETKKLPRVVPYVVYSHKARDFAEGGSVPVLLIDEP